MPPKLIKEAVSRGAAGAGAGAVTAVVAEAGGPHSHDLLPAMSPVDLGCGFLSPLSKCGEDGHLPHVDAEGGWWRAVNVSRVTTTDDDVEAWTTNPAAVLLDHLARVRLPSGRSLFMNDDRRKYVGYLAGQLSTLDTSGRLTGNCFSTMVTGPSGTGKSSFLQALVIAAQEVTMHTIAVWVDAGSVHGDAAMDSPALAVASALRRLAPPSMTTPGSELCQALTIASSDIGTMTRLLNLLGLRLLLITDEYPTVFSRPPPAGVPVGAPSVWTKQLYALGNNSAPGHLVVVGGSAPHMTSMCYGREPVDTVTFPSYPGKSCNLNSERFREWKLDPMSSPEESRAFLNSLLSSDAASTPLSDGARARAQDAVDSEAALCALFARTGGVLRTIGVVLHEADSEDVSHVSCHCTRF